MCQVRSRREKTHYFRFRTIERKIYQVCVFCGGRFYGYAAMNRPCPALQPGQGNWFTEIQGPATPDQYERRARELRITRVPPNLHQISTR